MVYSLCMETRFTQTATVNNWENVASRGRKTAICTLVRLSYTSNMADKNEIRSFIIFPRYLVTFVGGGVVLMYNGLLYPQQ